MARMTMDERIKRDGDRWRYIYFLEQELEKRKTKQSFIRISLTVNVVCIGLLIWWLP